MSGGAPLADDATIAKLRRFPMTPVIYKGGSANDDALLAQMFLERKKVFIDLLGWDLPALDDRFELDQFDLSSTLYIICADDQGEHLGSLRLIPCNQPYLLGTIFPTLCAAAPPASPDIWEISRLCLSRSVRAAERTKARNHLATALVQLALDNGIAGYCCVADEAWGAQIKTFGWRCHHLGDTRQLSGTSIGALQIAIDADTPDMLRRGGIWCEDARELRVKTVMEACL
jgi:acyl-homoserine lactone synthase